MSPGDEFAELFRRDLTRLIQELQAFPDDETLWRCLPGVSNPAGNLALHLEGNLREFIGRQLGRVSYQRQRDAEFRSQGVGRVELVKRIEAVRSLIPGVLSGLAEDTLQATHPENVVGAPRSTREVLTSLHGHLNYHLGQIDYLRRILTSGKAVEFAGLE
jgi:hypothetical protein